MVVKTFSLKEISAYKKSSDLSNKIYSVVSAWQWFDKQTLGSQIVRSVDSISANIAEGFGRYHKKDKIKFFYNARGSAFESIHWLEKATERKLIPTKEIASLTIIFQELPKEINSLILLTNKNLKY